MTETKLKIDGMMCGMCESHINDAIRRAFNVKKVTSSHSKGETVVLSEEPLDEEKLRAAIKETGYDLVSISAAPYDSAGCLAAKNKGNTAQLRQRALPALFRQLCGLKYIQYSCTFQTLI